MLQDAKIHIEYFSVLPIEMFAELWYNIKERKVKNTSKIKHRSFL